MENTIQDKLLKFPLFNDIKKEQLSTLVLCLKPKIHTYDRNDLIVIAGEEFDSIGLLMEGEATNKENISGSYHDDQN